jgi:FHS family Na+ dependent glucose MFS transporter 1
VLFLFCQGAESGFGGWIYVVAGELGFSDAQSAQLLSGFWGAFTIGRVLSIVVATRVAPSLMLTIDLLGAMASVAVLLLARGSAGVWVGSLALGLSLASVFPAALALAGERVRLTGAVTSRLFVGASLGTITVPWLLGLCLQLGPQALLLAILLDLAIAALIFLLIALRLRT